MDNNEFIPLKEIIISYRAYSLEKKLNILRKLSRDITFNEDYQFQIVNDGLIPIIINDLNNKLFLKKELNEHYLTYVRIFCMFLHNELGSDSSLQKIIFEQAFKIDNNFEILQNIINNYIKDLKVQKFLSLYFSYN